MVPIPRLLTAVKALLVLGVLAFLLRGADRPSDPAVERAGEGQLAPFGTVLARAVGPTGSVSEWCALLAATDAAHRQGLMDRVDLAGYDAMVFRYDEPRLGRFYMFRTLIPLSIAFLDDAGALVSAAEMTPCPSEDPDACPTYGATAPYRHAVEVPSGELPGLGIVPGATVTFRDEGC